MEIKLLAICIPTYNRGVFLKELLNSISLQSPELFPQIQICISDNASTDNTKNIVNDFKIKYPLIEVVYNVNIENIGADRNYLKCIEISTAKYCWIMGSDDAVYCNGITNVINALNKYKDFDLYVVNREACNKNMKHMFNEYWISSNDDFICHFDDHNSVREFFGKLDSTTALWGFLSVLIFRRSKWIDVEGVQEYLETAYVHVYIILSFLQQSGKMVYVKDICAKSRFGNDSFYEGLAQRILLDLNGYYKIAMSCENEIIRKGILSVLRKHYNKVFIYALKISYRGNMENIVNLLQNIEYNDKYISILNCNNKLVLYFGLFWNIIVFMFHNPKRFTQTMKITLVKLFSN